jgi:hypothetical protein
MTPADPGSPLPAGPDDATVPIGPWAPPPGSDDEPIER